MLQSGSMCCSGWLQKADSGDLRLNRFADMIGRSVRGSTSTFHSHKFYRYSKLTATILSATIVMIFLSQTASTLKASHLAFHLVSSSPEARQTAVESTTSTASVGPS